MKEQFKKLCYELYKLNWKSEHKITAECEMKTFRQFIDYKMSLDNDITYDDYISGFGFDGHLIGWACYDEFCTNEYLDTEFMESILQQPNLIDIYRKNY